MLNFTTSYLGLVQLLLVRRLVMVVVREIQDVPQRQAQAQQARVRVRRRRRGHRDAVGEGGLQGDERDQIRLFA
jgi:hypothetical protein